MEVRAWLTVCWLERRQFFSWAAADCGDEVGLTEFAEFTSGVEGRVEEGPGDPGDAGSAILLPTWLQPPPPPLTGLDKQERAPVPKGALQRGRKGEKGGEGCHQFRVTALCLSTLVQTELSTPRRWTAVSSTADRVSGGGVLMVPLIPGWFPQWQQQALRQFF